MADINKRLRISAELDRRKLRQQISELKQDFKQINIADGGNFAAFDKSVAGLKDAAGDLRKAIAEFRKITPKAMSAATGRQGVAAAGMRGPAGLAGDNERRKDLANAKKIEDMKDKRHASRVRDLERALSGLGPAPGAPAAPAGGDGGGLPTRGGGFMQRFGARAIGGRAGAMIGRAGAVAGGVAGVVAGVGLAGQAVSNFYSSERQLRQQRAERSQEQAQMLLSNQAAEARIREGGREAGESGLSGVSAGIGETFSDIVGGINPFSDRFGSGLVRAFTGRSFEAGGLRAGGEEAETRAAEARLGLGALGRARGFRGARIQSLRGGGVSGADLTALQLQGAGQGFGINETNQQFQAARGFLGNQFLAQRSGINPLGGAQGLPGTRSNLNIMQALQNITGMDVGAQAQSIEALTGGQRGGTFAQGTQRSVEILKKGVAAGLDVSRSGQFLQATAEFVEQNAGFGQLDMDRLSQNLATAVSGFAGGGAVSRADIQRAQRMEQMLGQEAISETGFAGAGNVLGIQEALGENINAERFIALQRVGANASQEDIQEILQRTGMGAEEAGAAAETFAAGRRNNQQRAFEAMGIDPESGLALGMGARERGIRTEEQLGIRRARGGTLAGDDSVQAQFEAARQQVEQSEEQRSVVADSIREQETFSEGMRVMSAETKNASEDLKVFSERLKESTQQLERMLRNTHGGVVSNTGG